MEERRALSLAFASGVLIGALGGLIGLGGAEFRLPVLIGIFGFAALDAVIVNKAMSLLVVTFGMVARFGTIPPDLIATHWGIVANVLAGSLIGAWLGAGVALRLRQSVFHRIVAALLVVLSVVLLSGHDAPASGWSVPEGWSRIVAGVVAGVAIGVVASMLGVAGGELIIPVLVMLYGVEIKLAGSLSLLISLPTLIVGITRYSFDRSIRVLRVARKLVLTMGTGSIIGAVIGGRSLGLVPSGVLLPALALILLVSAVKLWRQKLPAGGGAT